jgi:hypothetical protein
MLEGLILGILSFASMCVSFMKLPLKGRQFLLKHRVFTDVGAAGLCFLLISGVSKSVAALFASITCGLLVGVSIEVADMAANDEEISSHLEKVKENFMTTVKTRTREAIMELPT